MKIYLSATCNNRNDLIKSLGFGLVYSPYDMRTERPDIPYILDNGAFTAFSKRIPWDSDLFYCAVRKYSNYDFVVIPDIVAGGSSSLQRSIEHVDKLKRPRYLAVQNGMRSGDARKLIPYIDGIFIGGDMIWKFREADYWCNFAHNNGLKCHIGRIGTKRLYDWAIQVGVDSVDGSTPVRHEQISEIPKWLIESKNQTRITEVTS